MLAKSNEAKGSNSNLSALLTPNRQAAFVFDFNTITMVGVQVSQCLTLHIPQLHIFVSKDSSTCGNLRMALFFFFLLFFYSYSLAVCESPMCAGTKRQIQCNGLVKEYYVTVFVA